MSTYTLTQAEYRRLKTRLTFRENRLKKAQAAHRGKEMSRDLQKRVVEEAKQLLAEATYAMKIFDEKGSPDAWSRWERAKEDAQFNITRWERSLP